MRKLATIRRIDSLTPIPGAQNIETARIDGWDVVVKINEFAVGDYCIYHEIDSLLPDLPMYDFLVQKIGKIYPIEYIGSSTASDVMTLKPRSEKMARLQTIRLRGQFSQGLALPTSVLNIPWSYGDDLTSYLGVKKYELPVPTQLAGLIRGSYPSWLPKTDQERVQNIWDKLVGDGLEYRVEEKLDGSSISIYMEKGRIGVTSRNVDFKMEGNDDNVFVSTAKKSGLIEFLEKLDNKDQNNIAIRGELVGPGIQGNIYRLKEHRIYIFDVWKNNRYLFPEERDVFFAANFEKFHFVPVLVSRMKLPDRIDEVIKMADGSSDLLCRPREGLVFKSLRNSGHTYQSFKSISREFLLKGG